MNRSIATRVFESLSSEIRLDVYRLLMKEGTQGLVAGQIAEALDLPPTNLSFHLKAMTQAGLLTVQQEGRFQRYRADASLMLELVAYITSECCGGHPELCALASASARAGKAARTASTRRPGKHVRPL